MMAEDVSMLIVEFASEDHSVRDLEADPYTTSQSNFIGAFQDAFRISPNPYMLAFDPDEDPVEDPKEEPDENLIK